ncbi:MAG: NADH-quinone oxidoreductase subunit J [Planctomycetes bacterium]|nr:NADH-quinone oxidoreductase subunit J [Planctomycetota bacterium]
MGLLFLVSAAVALIGTVLLITQKNAVYALLGLLVAFGASAGIFLSLEAPFIAVSQILIYAGALAVMFLFVLMFTDTRTEEDTGMPVAVGARPDFDPAEHGKKKKKKKKKDAEPNKLLSGIVLPKPMAVVVALSLLVCFSFAIIKLPGSYSRFGDLPTVQSAQVKDGEKLPNYDTGLKFTPEAGETEQPRYVDYGSTEAVSYSIFEGFPLAFEVVSLLIFAAVLGAVLLARRHLTGIPGTQDVGKEQPDA